MGRRDEFEYSVVANRTVDPVPTRHGVYDSYDEAKGHIQRVAGSDPKRQQHNLKVITQPKGTAAKDLAAGRIKMASGAAAPKMTAKEKREAQKRMSKWG